MYTGYGASTAFLLTLAGNDSALVEEKLNSADEEIDESFKTAGYSTPLPITSIAAGVAKDRFVSRLASASKAIAGYLLSAPAEGTGRKGSSERVTKDCEDARAWLKRIANKELVVGVLDGTDGAVGAGSYTGMSVVGSSTWSLTEELMDIANLVTD